ncbi:hypothetical protein CDAR_544051 [Caerostris darwini]|uniref:Uncharacterized protein n=1 Tax=Caerostris darwini TaxID=1538125 RepID=A0AAV4TK57_9ARAC|nr:hypothetical protein CDAR_544051 [Caerostris darwini]
MSSLFMPNEDDPTGSEKKETAQRRNNNSPSCPLSIQAVIVFTLFSILQDVKSLTVTIATEKRPNIWRGSTRQRRIDLARSLGIKIDNNTLAPKSTSQSNKSNTITTHYAGGSPTLAAVLKKSSPRLSPIQLHRFCFIVAKK